jgi:drug/metabolite transporter (DMT)-like permease
LNNRLLYGYATAFLSAALFGSISSVAKPILSSQIQIPPLILASTTYLIAGIFMFFITLGVEKNKKKDLVKKGDYAILLLIGLIGAGIAPFLYFEGLKRTTASDASVLGGGEILFTVILALLFFKEKLTKVGYFGMSITLVGITLISLSFTSFSNIQNNYNFFNYSFNFGDILIIFSMLLWGLDNNISKIISKRISNTSKIVFIKSLTGGIILLLVSFLLGYKVNFDITQIPYLLILGIGAFGLSLFFFLESLRIIGTLKVIVILIQIIASVFIIFGLYYVNKDELNYLKKINKK